MVAKQSVRRTKSTAKPKRPISRSTKTAIKQKIRQTRPTHRKILLHPVTILLLLCAAVFLVCWTGEALASDFTVTAIVPAPALLDPAEITSPSDGVTITSSPTQVSGTCPANSYVKLYDNNLFDGTALCVSGAFQVSSSLVLEDNTLMAQDFNITNQPGPTGNSVTVHFIPPTSSPSPTSQPSSTTTSSTRVVSNSNGTSTTTPSAAPPLLLTSDFQYQTFMVNTRFTWSVEIEGGVSPYTVTVVWQDGQTSTYSIANASSFEITHTYSKAGYYPIIVKGADTAGNSRTLQIAALITLPGSSSIPMNPGTTGGSTTSSSASSSATNNFFTATKQWLWLAWPSFAVVALMITAFLLGERKEYTAIVKQRITRHHHA